MKRSELRVSLIIPAYNEERHLHACLDAVAAQTVQPYEVIVVDNGSTDQTATIAKGYPFVRVLSEPKRGIVHARNRGFNAARGDIIGRTDADVTLPPDWVEYVTTFYANPGHAELGLSGNGRPNNLRFAPVLRLAAGADSFSHEPVPARSLHILWK